MGYRELWVAVGVAVCVLLGLKASKYEQKAKNVCDEGNTSADTAGSSSSASKSEQKAKNVCDEGNTSADTAGNSSLASKSEQKVKNVCDEGNTSADTVGSSSSASKSEQKVKNVCDEGNTSADTAGSSSSASKSEQKAKNVCDEGNTSADTVGNSSSASKSEQKVKNVCDEGNTSADTVGSSSSTSKSEQKVKNVCDEGNTSADVAGSSSSTVLGGEFEVFLSFRGEDNRKTFTDHLYHALLQVGIRTFRDNEELRVGEEISSALPKAIKESTISIPIFSKDYASSKWCLRELAKMVEFHKTMGHKILPIFYDVEPSDVRHQTGTYEEAFRKHQNHFKEDTVQRWKEALKEVGEMKGWELEKETKGHEGELVKKVVSKVLLELKKNYMVVTDNLVGIYHHEEEMTKLLDVDFNGVRIVGIHGMGGIGKTTIAKVIYNKFSVHFDCCCFLPDVRETSQQNGLLNLQNQLMSKIQKQHTNNVDEGINTIKRIFCNKKVFIVLDDVDDKSQFDKIVGKRDWFGLGSRIIITTRDKHVLNLLQVDRSYEPPIMEFCHSLQLFSKHAFMRESPPEDYHAISKRIVSTAAGLPLALEIIGSFLYGKKKAAWEDTLKKLKEIPNDNVQEKLRISYTALDDFQQKIFLDIACFFNGVDKRLPFYFWDGCKFFPNDAVEVLELRSLVKIGDYNILMMHDQLKDLGRKIVYENNLDDPGEHSRLFRHDKALDVLENRRGTRNVEALELICSTEGQSLYCFTAEEFKELRNLRYLRVDYADIDGDFKGIFLKLRWLQWSESPRQFSPSNIDLKNLVILDLSQNKFLKDDWEGWSQIKMAKGLKVLNLSFCYGITRTPDLSTLTALEIFKFQQYENSLEIHPSIWQLKNLRVLDISSMSRATGTRLRPEKPIKPIKFPDEIGNLEKLEEMYASGRDDFHGEIPSSIGRLSSLRILELQCTNICSLPTSISGLSHLEDLDLYNCDKLQSLPDKLPSSLTSLRVPHQPCQSMETFPGCLSNLINLKYLDLCSCVNLVEITSDTGKLSQLETLTLAACDKLRTLPAEIGAISRLKKLKLSRCRNLQCILALPPSLSEIHVLLCPSLEGLPDLSNLKNLSTLKLQCLDKLKEISQLGGGLEDLMISLCESLERLPDLSNLKNLQRISIESCKSLERLPDLSNLKKLQRISIEHCKKLIEIQGFEKLELLTALKIRYCESLERLPDVSNLGMLKDLELHGCQKLVEIEGLGVLKSLKALDVSRTSLERLDLSSLKNLKGLKILHCKNLTEIQGLEELESLEFLNMAACKLIEKLPDLSNLKKLKILIAFFCEKLTEIWGLEELQSLKLLDISGCKSMERLSDLSNSKTWIDTDSRRAEIWEADGWEVPVPGERAGWESE